VGPILADLVTVYIVVLFVRAVLSWFPLRPGTFLSSLNRLVIDLTEPVLRPFRRIIPPAGVFDLSFLVVLILLYVLRAALASA
jgi:YggT family protein